MRWPPPSPALRALALGVVSVRLALGVVARPPLCRSSAASGPGVSVVVPARDEAARIGPLLAALRGAPDVVAVVVVDDGSSDATAAVAAAAGASVVTAPPPPVGWAGKTWATSVGLGAVATEWVVVLDADVEPDPVLPRSAVHRAVADDLDVLTLAAQADLADGPARWLHAAMLTQLVYRFGPPGTGRRLASGQCVVARRDMLADGLAAVRSHLVEDVALVRHLVASGRRVDFLDATDLLVVRPYDDLGGVWSGWGRSIGLRGVESPWRQVVETTLLSATLVLPLLRIVGRRADRIDAAGVVLRLGTLVGMRRAHRRRGVAYWSSPLADPVGVAAMVSGLVRRSPTWRGRVVGERSRSAARRST